MSLAISLATRGRPQMLKPTIERTLANMRLASTRLLVAIDDDDAVTVEAMPQLPRDDRVAYSARPREDTLGAKYNRVLALKADVYLAMVDYAPHVTPGFDEKILEAASSLWDGYGVVYNHWANLSFPQINAVTAKLVARQGFLYPPYFPYWFIDHWLDDIARMIERIAIADVWIDTSARNPQTHRTHELREADFWGTLFDVSAVMRRRCAREIIKSEDFDETAGRKRFLLGKCSPWRYIEEHSVLVNNICRENARGWESELKTPPPGDGYARARAEGMKLMAACVAELEADAATVAANRKVDHERSGQDQAAA
jgi:hypothetical protein